MERVAIVARLKEESGRRAAEVIAAGPPFELAETGITRHRVYLSASEVVALAARDQFGWGDGEAEPAATEAMAGSRR
jgi:hypothetical protein